MNGNPSSEGAKGWFVLLSDFVSKPGGVAVLVLSIVFGMAAGLVPSQLTENNLLLKAHAVQADKREERLVQAIENMAVTQGQVSQWLRISVCEQLPKGDERNKCYAIGLTK